AVINDLLFLQYNGGPCNARSSHTKHLGNKFLCQIKLDRLHAIADFEQPARTSLIKVVDTVTTDVPRYVSDQRLRIFEHDRTHLSITVEFGLYRSGGDS